MEYLVVLITTPKDEAENLAQTLVEERLAACINLVPQIDSIFWWEGKIDRATETLLIAKTSKACLENLIHRVKKLHSYTVPEIIALPIISGNNDYLSWLAESVKET